MAKIRRAKKHDAFKMFCYAQTYYDAAADLNAVSKRYTLPACILQVFSIELFLKCLKRVRGKRPMLGHDIKNLFDDLSMADRRAITRHFNMNTGIAIDGKKMHVEDALIAASTYFADVRYGYEKHIWGNLGFSGIAGGARMLILRKHPDWESRYLTDRML